MVPKTRFVLVRNLIRMFQHPRYLIINVLSIIITHTHTHIIIIYSLDQEKRTAAAITTHERETYGERRVPITDALYTSPSSLAAVGVCGCVCVRAVCVHARVRACVAHPGFFSRKSDGR